MSPAKDARTGILKFIALLSSLVAIALSFSVVVAEAAQATSEYQANCDHGIAAACNLLALQYAKGEGGLPRDTAKAAALFKQLCDDRFGPSCSRMGEMLEAGNDASAGKKDPVSALSFYEKGCAAGDMDGCMDGGDLAYAGAAGVAKDLTLASNYYFRACQAGSAEGCLNRANSLEGGIGAQKDLQQAAILYSKACQQGAIVGCLSLGILFDRGEGVQKDPVKAVQAYDYACERANAQACTGLGNHLLSGEGVTKDPAKAAQAFTRACQLGDKTACSRAQH